MQLEVGGKENRTYMRNFFGGSGYGLEKGQGYYHNFMVFINGVNYGFTDYFSLGVTTEFASLFSGLEFNPGFFISPKFSFPVTENLINIGIGGVLLHVPGSDQLLDFGAIYGVGTYGSKDRNISIGLGFSVVDGTIDSSPAIILSGNYRLGNGISVITENWLFSDFDTRIYTFGLRTIGGKVTWELTIVGVVEDGFLEIALSHLLVW